MKTPKLIYNTNLLMTQIINEEKKNPWVAKMRKVLTWWQLPTNWSIKRMNPSHLWSKLIVKTKSVPHRVSQDPRKEASGHVNFIFRRIFLCYNIQNVFHLPSRVINEGRKLDRLQAKEREAGKRKGLTPSGKLLQLCNRKEWEEVVYWGSPAPWEEYVFLILF